MRHRVRILSALAALSFLWLVSTSATTTKSAVEETVELDTLLVASSAQRRGQSQRQRRRTPARPTAATQRAARVDYTSFDHASAQHRKASCDACHKFPSGNWKEVRAKDAFPDITQYPEHASCLECHRTQFFARERPVPKICSVCHQSATPRNTERWPFPTLAEKYDATTKARTAVSDFGVSFPHDKHEGLFSELNIDASEDARFLKASFERSAPQDDPAKANAACATCHQTYMPQGDSPDEYVTKPPKDLAEGAFWLKKGTFKTSPRDHASCFTCHSAEGGMSPMPNECASCHKLLTPAQRLNLTSAHDDFDPKLAATMGITDRTTLLKWSGRKAGRFNHEYAPHDLACASCHKTERMNRAEPAERFVPVISCGGEGTGCHIEPTPDGLLNTVVAQKTADPKFVCTKCHVMQGSMPLPDSHSAAVRAATTPKK